MTEDPKKTLMTLLSSNWDDAGVGFTPKFSTDWYDRKEEMPQVVISHMITEQRFLGLTADPTAASQKRTGIYAVDVWSKGDQIRRWKMIEEVTRILKAKCNAPGGDLEFIRIISLRDLDEMDVSPKIYRTQTLLEVLYYQ